jgi:outer membrane protein assembly factor BamB
MNENLLFKKGLVVGIILLFVATGIIPSTAQNIKKSSMPTSSIDWWPMICHDPAHSGYSTSTIPDKVMMLWKNSTVGFIESSPSIVNGRFFITTADFANWEGYIYCYDMQTGACLWVYDGSDEFFSSPTIANNAVFACTLNGNFYCLNASTGIKLWSVKLGSHLLFEDSSPAVVDGRIYICCYKDDGSYNGSIFCLDADDGDIIWQINPGNNNDYSPAIVNGRIYAAGFHNQLSCFDSVDGDLLWMCPGVVLSTHPSVMNETVFVGTQDGRICCVENGSILWQYQAPSNYLITNPPIFAYGRVYTGLYSPSVSTPDKILCLDAGTGTEYWSRSLEEKGGVGYIPAIADGKLIVLSSYMYDYPPDFDRIINVHCYDSTSGEPLWSYEVGEGKDNYAYNSPGIADGRLYICTTEMNGSHVWGGVYCLSTLEYTSPCLSILKPENALYVRNRKIIPLRAPLIVGAIDITVNATDNQSGMNKVEFYIDDQFVSNDTASPYTWNWNVRTLLHWNHVIKIIAYNNAGNQTTKEISVRKFF